MLALGVAVGTSGGTSGVKVARPAVTRCEGSGIATTPVIAISP